FTRTGGPSNTRTPPRGGPSAWASTWPAATKPSPPAPDTAATSSGVVGPPAIGASTIGESSAVSTPITLARPRRPGTAGVSGESAAWQERRGRGLACRGVGEGDQQERADRDHEEAAQPAAAHQEPARDEGGPQWQGH